jgi:hypothetical protein
MLAMSKTRKSHDKENSINSKTMVEAVDHRSLRRTFSATFPGADVVEREKSPELIPRVGDVRFNRGYCPTGR